MIASLAPLRAEIDAIDDEIVALLGKRLSVVHRVAVVKMAEGLPAILPDRVEAVKALAAERGMDYGLDPVFMAALYQMIIDEACRVEEGIFAAGPQDTPRS
ncbi:chorismate mutase [Azospirillum doebereinerae]|uniref:chorismate mutase n=1 Tax=Azospirillum doebereinerae TaxID=92933 RepID=A0A433J856_9PROT|nr:chorismate mutase [Azospirillum doebereinerae]MCG5241823.1 chorismate mutase [Azospirillum doebereinerae]RUQ70153.1 chorismate mutase [Azospirillum doebereinerae]